MEDFNVDTEGHCFFCMEKTSLTKLEPASESGSAQSLQHLSLYLKMNRKKVFNDEELIPPELLAKVEKSRLKADLCPECASLNKQFSKLSRHLEMTELKMASCLELINIKLLKAEKRGTNRQSAAAHELCGKLQVVNVLRTEAMTRCSQKLGKRRPRVEVRKMSMNAVNRKKAKLQRDSRSGGELMNMDKRDESVGEASTGHQIGVDNFKIESGSSNLAEDYNDTYEDGNYDNGFNYFEEQTTSPPTTDNKPLQEREAFSNYSVYHNSSFQERESSRISYKDTFTIDSQSGKHVCRDCSREYSSLRSFQLHYQREHLKIRYKCRLCEEEFKQLVQLNRHQKSVHNPSLNNNL